ncbi:MAG: YidC/Oxa1 family insertase periplasmic-domain containing protein, partial [Planctomycetia bacterium]|nr:YidC/Oxa1 family insertase periplasmic-domain containing protein [Planctomycetia bacterium]
MDRRYIQFFAISLAIVVASQLLQTWLFPRPPQPAVEALATDGPAVTVAAEGKADRKNDAVARAADVDTADAAVAAGASAPAKRMRRTLGSLDPKAARMLVTLTSRGAAVERIELADEKFHDQDDRSGYLGHLAVEEVDGGCRVGVAGAGTPAARAGLKPGDVIASVGGTATPDAAALAKALGATKPGAKTVVEVLRDGATSTLDVALERRPLEVVRPEYRTTPVEDPDGNPHDPLSFRLSLESREGRNRPAEPLAEIPGCELADVDWTIEEDADADPTRVRFTRTLPGGLTAVKEYRLATTTDESGPDGGYGLELTVELRAAGKDAAVSYALDGPTGLPTEGWWYTQRVARDWGSLAVRDVALRFVGKQSAIVSGLKVADGKLDFPASAVGDGTPLSFAGVDALYFAAALIPAREGPDAPALAEVRPLAVGDVPTAARKKLIDVTSRLVSRDLVIPAGGAVTHRYGIFAGPKRPELLARYGVPGSAMDDLVYYGWFGWVARPMIAILHALHSVIGNYGLAVLLLTVFVRAAMFPVSRKQAISSQKMQELQPEMKAINEKFKDDPTKKTQATQELWRKHNYNPMGGCLLVFIQVPIFMGLYRSLATDVELRQAPLFSSAIRWCSNLAAPDMLWDWSKVLPAFLTAPEGWLGPFLNLFPLVTIGLMLWQQKLFMPPAVDEQQKV